MANNETYKADPAADLAEVLEACLWERVRPGLWEKGRSRLLVDHVGLFHFRLYDNQWVRIAGLSHNNFLPKHRAENYIKFPGSHKLNLLTGDYCE